MLAGYKCCGGKKRRGMGGFCVCEAVSNEVVREGFTKKEVKDGASYVTAPGRQNSKSHGPEQGRTSCAGGTERRAVRLESTV